MTRQEAREELRNYREHLKKRKRLHNRVEELRCAMESPRVFICGGETKAPNPYDLEELIDKLEKAERKYQRALWEQLEIVQKVECKVSKLKGNPYKVIYYRYIEGKRQIEIAFKLNMSIEWVKRNEYKGLDGYASLTEE